MLKEITGLFLILFLKTCCYANANISIKGRLEGGIENASVVLIQYNLTELQIAKTLVKSKVFIFNDLKNLNDGVYSIIINYPDSSFKSKQSVYRFDIIIDESESLIEIEFNPTLDRFPNIQKSQINSNYYKYLQLETEKINEIKQNQLFVGIQKEDLLNSNVDVNNISEKIKQEVNENKIKYIENNFNKWSTALVKNSTSLLEINNISKNKYWSLFQTNNSSLINTPIFQDIAQCYIIQYYSKADEEGYKEAFNEIIKQFSENKVTKVWVVKYVIIGLKHIGNKDLEDYFSKKYKYEI